MVEPSTDAAVARVRRESIEEIRLGELRHAQAISQPLSWPGGSC